MERRLGVAEKILPPVSLTLRLQSCRKLSSKTPSSVRLPGEGQGGEGCCGEGDLLNLLIELTGEKKKDKATNVAAARMLWVPAVNNRGGFGRWGFIEIADPWDAENLIRTSLKKG